MTLTQSRTLTLTLTLAASKSSHHLGGSTSWSTRAAIHMAAQQITSGANLMHTLVRCESLMKFHACCASRGVSRSSVSSLGGGAGG